MRIAYVYDAVYPWETGGVQKRVWEIAHRLAADHDVHWYGLKYWDGPSVRQREGVTLHGVMDPTELYVEGRRSIPEALSYSAHLLEPLLRESFDVIDCQQFPYFPAFPCKLQSVLRQTTLVMTWHEVWGTYWYDYLGRPGVLGRAIEQLTASLPNEHVAVSPRTKRDLADLGVGDVSVVPNGISMDEIDAVPPADDPVDVLYAGRLIPEKNVDLLVRAVDDLRRDDPDVTCVVVGDGPERPRIASLVDELGLSGNVRLTGRIADYDDVLALMKAASTFALPSRREGFGICALEALGCGTPVVTVDHPRNAAADLVEDGVTGAVCAESADAIATSITRARATATPSQCRAASRAYEWDRIAELTETLYESATGTAPAEPAEQDRPVDATL